MSVEQFLLSLGAPPYRIGFDQLVAAVEYVVAHPDCLHITREVYPAVAAQCGTTAVCIDHNLRCIIDYIWTNGDKRRLAGLFVAAEAYRPSNKAFVFTVARFLRINRYAGTAAARRRPDAPARHAGQ